MSKHFGPLDAKTAVGTDRIAAMLERFITPLFVAVAVSLPLSVRLYFRPIDLEVIFPAEPLIGVLFLLIAALVLLRRDLRRIPSATLRHPVIVLVLAWLTLLATSALVSDHAIVSAKALLVRSVFAVLFFLVPVFLPMIMRIDRTRLLLLHGAALIPVVLYAWASQADAGYDRGSAGLAPFPFYVDHTSYAVVAVFALFTFGTSAWWMYQARPRSWAFAGFAVLTLFMLVAFFLSYCRAAWLSVLPVLILIPLLQRRIAFRKVLLAGSLAVACAAVLAVVFVGRGNTLVDSNSTGAGFKESILSLTNVSSDTSNKERVNRWKCAYRMFRDEPLLGHGVGTFQFAYLPYQRKDEMTYVSVTGPIDPKHVQRVWSASEELFVRRNPQLHYCTGGTAHNEFLLALSESGLFACLVLLALVLFILHTGWRGYLAARDARSRALLLGAFLPVMAYFIHALFNNFLDDPKVAFPFWMALGITVSMDLTSGEGVRGSSGYVVK